MDLSNKITILIVNWNAGDYLIRCLQSIPDNYPVILVDNHSIDGSADKVNFLFPAVKIIRSFLNLGFSAGNNLGLREVRTKYVLFLNPDTEIIEDAIEQLANFLEESPDYDAVGPQIIEDGEPSIYSGRRHLNLWISFCTAFSLNNLFKENRWLNYFPLTQWDNNTSRDVDCLYGCAMLVRTSVVKEIGGFDEAVPLYLDDMDLCRKITNRGAKIYCLIPSRVQHIQNVCGTKAPSAWLTLLQLRAQYEYLKKYDGRLIASAFLFVTFSASIGKIFTFSILSFFNNYYRKNLSNAWNMLTFSLYYFHSKRLKKCPG
jgi:N-acetylglucosaminyl-diphospho-decaprenol L-rhamnosyltransferase